MVVKLSKVIFLCIAVFGLYGALSAGCWGIGVDECRCFLRFLSVKKNEILYRIYKKSEWGRMCTKAKKTFSMLNVFIGFFEVCLSQNLFRCTRSGRRYSSE